MQVSRYNLLRMLLIAVLGVCFQTGGVDADQPVGLLADSQQKPAVTFELDIQPLLTRFGCNSGPCHGKARGQNGFALSLLGFDSEFDYAALVQEGRGRRIFRGSPEQSLLMRKATGEIPHGGGGRFEVGSSHYNLLIEWIRAGSPRTPADAPKLVKVEVEPKHQSLRPKEATQLRVIAEYSDGRTRDVTDASA
ncbi:MAG: S-layer protein, partial [Planctomycetaceae bacterium]|nr:S-layer protein [Planctomycetaceae bacterium]